MGKLLVTNNKIWFDSLRKEFTNTFQENYIFTQNNFYMCVYKKLNIDSENYYVDGKDFIAGTGTLIYKQLMGKDALLKMLESSKTSDIKELRKNSLGSFAVVIKKENNIDIFVDETHTYYLYYYTDGTNYIVTNTYWHIGKIANLRINEFALLEQGSRRCIMSNLTPINGVYKLSASKSIHINLDDNTFEENNVIFNDYHTKFKDSFEAVNTIASEIKEVSQIRSKYVTRCMHFLTGGIDSRLEASIHIFNKDRLIFGYWMGKDSLTNGTEKDKKIVEEISKQYGIEHKIFDVCEDFKDSLTSLSALKCSTFGEFSSTYGGNTKLFSIFENIKDCNWCGFGYLGEMLRPLNELDRSYIDKYTVHKFVRDVYCRADLGKLFELDGFYEFIENEMFNILKLNDKNIITKDQAFKLFSYSRYDADSYMNNFVNMFMYSFPIFGQKRIADLIDSLEYSWLKDDFISIALVKQFEERLLSFPIYSHHREFIFNKRSLTMIENSKYKFLDNLKPVLKNTPIYKILYLKWLHKYIRPQSSLNDEICKECAKRIRNSTVMADTSYKIKIVDQWDGTDMGTLARFTADVIVLDSMRGKKDNV